MFNYFINRTKEPEYFIGERVSREIDIFDKSKGRKIGSIIKRYSEPKKIITSDFILGPYPELYSVKWDDGEIHNGYFWWGLSRVPLLT